MKRIIEIESCRKCPHKTCGTYSTLYKEKCSKTNHVIRNIDAVCDDCPLPPALSDDAMEKFKQIYKYKIKSDQYYAEGSTFSGSVKAAEFENAMYEIWPTLAAHFGLEK